MLLSCAEQMSVVPIFGAAQLRSIDFGPVLAALRRRDYRGWLGYECRPATDVEALACSVWQLRALWDRAA